VGVVALGFLLSVALGVSGIFGGSRALGAATTITIISGQIQVRHAAGGDFVAATDGEVLTAGDTIRTGDDSRGVLTYFEGSTVTLEPNTELAIIDASAKTDGSTVVVMQQNLGRTWHVVTKLIQGNSKYEVRTPASTASVRGTAFTVGITFEDNAPVATVTTTEGTVVHSAPDPQAPGQVVEVPVTAGTTEKIKKGETPRAPEPMPEPERKVTVVVRAGNTLVVDPLGRTNGITPDGKVVIQTPGAQVRRDGDTIVIVLPDIPDGKLSANVDKKKDSDTADVVVHTTVEDKGKDVVELEDTAKTNESKKATAGVELKKSDGGNAQVRPLDENEKKDLKETKVGEAPKPEDATDKDKDKEQDKDSGSSGGGGGAANSAGAPGQEKDKGSVNSEPAPQPRANEPARGFVPPPALPQLPVTPVVEEKKDEKKTEAPKTGTTGSAPTTTGGNPPTTTGGSAPTTTGGSAPTTTGTTGSTSGGSTSGGSTSGGSTSGGSTSGGTSSGGGVTTTTGGSGNGGSAGAVNNGGGGGSKGKDDTKDNGNKEKK
jgi:hypothetical protein